MSVANKRAEEDLAVLLSGLRSQGVQLWQEDGQLRFKAPAGVLTEALRQRLKRHKAALLQHLSTPLVAHAAARFDPFPLTDLQLAYLVGRGNLYEFGGVGCHCYIELEVPQLDAARLERAWHQLIQRHDMLRAVVSPAGHQRVLRQVALPPLRLDDWRGATDAQAQAGLAQTREAMGQRCYPPDQWPLHELRLSHQGEISILHFSMDLLVADFASIQILLNELGKLYRDPELKLEPLAITYRDLLLAQQQAKADAQTTAASGNDRRYWLERIASGFPPPPELPVLSKEERAAAPISAVAFGRLHFALPAAQWKSLRTKAARGKHTASGVVLAAFAETVARWSRHGEFCINLTLLNRPALHPDVNRVVGDFIAVNVLAVSLDAQATFAERVTQLQQRLLQDMEHTGFTGIDVLRELSQRHGSQVMVPVVFTSTVGVKGEGLDGGDFMQGASLRYGITQTPQVWLDCQVTERGDSLQVDWDIRNGVFKPGTVESAFDAFCGLLRQLADDDDIWHTPHPITLPREMLAARVATNYGAAPLPMDGLHSGFCRSALARPETVALIADGQALSYGELAAWASRLCHRLRQAGCAAGAPPVAIVMDKGAGQIAAILSALLAGVAYLPIDGTQPPLRRNRMLADAGVRWVLTDAARMAEDWPATLRCISVERSEDGATAAPQESLLAGCMAGVAEQPAYILYTSGTTGQPKGVAISHRAALNTVRDINRRFAVGRGDKVLGLAHAHFDLSVWDIFGSFEAGATLVLPQARLRNDPAHWVELIAACGVTLWNSVPAQMQMLMSSLERESGPVLPSLRLAMLSGDWIPVSLPDAVRARCPGIQLVGLGGPTETAIWCVWHPIGEVAPGSVSIPYGRPLSNHRLAILNERLEACPDWVAGEMYIGGAGLAIGYVGDEARTRECFIRHPLSGEHLYRSGDICRYRSDGVIEILGREDSQVKLLGHRVELGEVEAAFLAQDGVRQAVAVLRDGPALAAAIVWRQPPQEDDDQQTAIARVKAGVAARLPDYMVPAQIQPVAAIPLSINGKIDRAALRQLLAQAPVAADSVYEAPRDSGVEPALAEIWQDLLGLARVSRNDDFFQVGGSSLSAITLLSKLLAKNFAVDVELIFGNPVFHQMAQALERSKVQERAFIDGICLDDIAAASLADLGTALPCDSGHGLRHVLLTGATGYLGIHTLVALLADTDYTVHCLVRCQDAEQGRQRLQHAAEQKGLQLDARNPRIHLVSGDVVQDRLGTDESAYRMLCEDVDCIIHGASMINLMDPLARLYPTNVLGAARIISLAATSRVKPVHYISTIAVHHALPSETVEPVPESTPATQAWRDITLTYEQSKTMAEQLFYRARAAGLPVSILRPGTITWDSGLYGGRRDADRVFINDDAFLKFYRACQAIAAYPRSSLSINMVPVDYVAKCIACIVRSEPLSSENYHLVSERSVPVDDVYDILTQMGAQLVPLPFPEWKARLRDSFVEGFVNLYFRDGMGNGGHHQYGSDALRRVLMPHGVAGFSVSRDYLRILQKHCPES